DLEATAMLEGGNARAGVVGGRKVDIGEDDTRLLAGLRQHLTPGRHDQTVPVGGTAVLVRAALCGSKHEGARLDRSSADEHAPMRFTRLLGESRRDGNEAGSGRGERTVERGEAEVVADAQAEPPKGEIGDDGLVARLEELRLAVALAAREIDVEHMQLVVARG